MLTRLYISNYALIEEVEVALLPGFTVITGETGSGKSIMMDAMGLILGGRADMQVLKDPGKKCVVEATFDLRGYSLNDHFEQAELDYDDHTTIRRELSPAGKSRAFVNDTPVQLQTLRELTSHLIDIHSQHENMLLGQRDFQFQTIDTFAGNSALCERYRNSYKSFITVRKNLDEVLKEEARLKSDLDYYRFQWNELAEAELDKLDEEALRTELESITHAETIASALSDAHRMLDESESGALAQLASAKGTLQKAAAHHALLPALIERLEGALIELRDIASEMELSASNLFFDEARIEHLNSVLARLGSLKKKHGVDSVHDLKRLRNELEEKINLAANLDEHIAHLQNELTLAEQELVADAALLTASRRLGAQKLQQAVKPYFKNLALPHAELAINLEPAQEFGPAGRDEMQWLFSANKGSRLQPVKDVASGGEVSRIMLALKAAISSVKKMPALVLDEVDQGIGGQVAVQTAAVMKDMSTRMQLLVITHLPQIAGRAEHHLRVIKKAGKVHTTTTMQPIHGEERVNELAQMLAGKNAGKAALESARQLMK